MATITYLYRFSSYILNRSEEPIFSESFVDTIEASDSESADIVAQGYRYFSLVEEREDRCDRLSDVNGGVEEFVSGAGLDELLQAYESLEENLREVEASEETVGLTGNSPSPSNLIGLLSICLKSIEASYRAGKQPTSEELKLVLHRCKKDSWDDE
jgi:hypothetical protein